jgi:hypothetical protein
MATRSRRGILLLRMAEWHSSNPIGYNSAMKLQFSLATMLVCVTVLAVVCVLAIRLKVHQPEMPTGVYSLSGQSAEELVIPANDHSPAPSEAAKRLALWGPLSVAATLGALWAIRRVKSHRENGPPVG